MDDAAVAQFLAAPKTLSGVLRWSEHPNGAQVGAVPVALDAIVVGQVLTVVLAVRERRWSFKLKVGSHKALEWDLIPVGELRRHFNRAPRPDGFPAEDRSPAHEHLWIDGRKLSRPIPGLESCTHQEAFRAFCARANIDAGNAYTQPSETQLTLRR
jgi:hypothetical protein